jgi:hypothetical protein
MTASQMKTSDCANTLLRAAVGRASHQLETEACTAYGTSGNALKNDKALLNLSALN